MPVVEDSDQVLPLLRIGDAVETDDGPGRLTGVQFNTAQYDGRWELEPPQLIVELDAGGTIHTCLCSIVLPNTQKGTRLLHQEFNRLWPPRTDAVPEDADMMIPEGEEDTREGERNANMHRYADDDTRNDLDYYADMIISNLRKMVVDGYSESDLYDSLHEMVDQSVPVYYSAQLDLLNNDFNEIFFEDVGEWVSHGEISLSKVLPVAIYKALESKVHARWDELMEGEEEEEDDEYDDDEYDDDEYDDEY